MKIRTIHILIFVLIAIGLSLSIPFLLVYVYGRLGKVFGIGSTILPIPNYIQIVASLIAFFAATLISFSVLLATLRKENGLVTESACELIWYIEYSIGNITMFTQKKQELSLESKPRDFMKLLYKFKLTDKEIEDMKTLHERIQKIFVMPKGQSRDTECLLFISDRKLLTSCEATICKLKKLYLS